MATVATLGAEDIAKFDAFSRVTSTTFTSGSMTQIIELWGSLQRTTDMTYSSGNLATTTVTWETV
jgi:hypothetical protein